MKIIVNRQFPFFFLLVLFSTQAWAQVQVIPSIELREVVVDNEELNGSESGYVTTVSPRVLVESSGTDLDVLMNYGVDVIRPNNLEEDDREVQQLDLNSEYRHIPSKWTSYIMAATW
ncbi:MAG: hypothetical protein AAF391_12340, partial [Bacteroidota bacterium]